MRLFIQTILLAFSLVSLGVTIPHAGAAQAATTAAEVEAAPEPQAVSAEEPGEDEMDRGWIGIVTLAGAAGFMILAMVLLGSLVRRRQRR